MPTLLSPTAGANSPLVPFLKWAGGKRWFAARYLGLFPTRYRTYFEPFLGSGAVFFALTPKDAVLSDSNSELIATYNSIQTSWKEVYALLESHQLHHSEKYYYSIRQLEPTTDAERAARLIYLNRTCWNGLYRVNKSGTFNVPKGTKDSVLMPTDDFGSVSQLLKNARIYTADFEKTIGCAKAGDFIFVDPPYTVNHNKNGFLKYNQHIFGWKDQLRLHTALSKAKRRGVLLMITNADHISIRELYNDLGTCISLPRQSVLAAHSEHRKPSSEILIRSWE